MGHYRGNDCLRKFSNECGAENPDAITSTMLRKHVATMCEMLSLKDNEMDELADFLGHDIRIYREFYRLPDHVIQVAEISRILLATESGTLRKYSGKSLDEIDLIFVVN